MDGAGFVTYLAKSLEKGSRPSESERMFLRDQLAAASGRELKQWALALRESQLPDPLKKEILVSIAPRMAEHDPKMAAELVVAGDDGNAFRSVIRAWLSKDAVAASAWLEEMEVPQFKNPEDLNFPALSLAAKVAADPVGMDELLEANGKLALAALWELSATQSPADLASVLHRVSLESKLPESDRLHVIGGTLARYRDPSMARQIVLDAGLSGEQFVKVASTMIGSLDPAGKTAGIEWAKSLPASENRAELLRLLSASDGP
ncbi:MAG TPA: hypothetical protein VGE67_07445 [Haloferula sp.]